MKPALLPQPRSLRQGHGWLRVTGSCRVEWLGHRSAMLDRAVSRFKHGVAQRTGLEAGRVGTAQLRIDCRGDTKGYLTIEASERYSLAIKDDTIVLQADGPAGVLHGLATLRQAITNVAGGFAIPGMAIDDAPRFVWRGVMIDVARHFMSLPTLKRQIDAMELVKLNVLHLHLSDNEVFRVESILYPKLHEGLSPDCYSQADIRELVAYAADRGVRIVPEFDVRGNPETYVLLDRLFGEMSGLFPDPYFHVGGDDAGFFDRVRQSVAAHGKHVVGWEEAARAPVPDDVVVQTSRSAGALARVTGQGNRVIATCGYYFDKLWPCESYYAVDPHDPTSSGLTRAQFEEAKAKGLPAALLAEDAVIDPSLKLSATQRALVLGGEGALWTELVTEEMLDGRLWPAAAALAERLWSPASVRDPKDMYRRLIVVHDGLRVAGLEDDANRRRMAERLAPGESEPVALLLDLVAPVRNHAHDRAALALLKGEAPAPQDLNELADAASADSLVARHFVLDAQRFAEGDRSGAAALEATLVSWRDNHGRFAAVAKGIPQLEAALPISAEIAALAEIGLDAMGGFVGDHAHAVLDRQAVAAKASESIVQVATMQQPAADLLISITEGIRTLVDAAPTVVGSHAERRFHERRVARV